MALGRQRSCTHCCAGGGANPSRIVRKSPRFGLARRGTGKKQRIVFLVMASRLFLNDITRYIVFSNGAEILLIYYGYRVYPQVHEYTIVAFHPRVFQGYRIYFIPWEDHVERTGLIIYILLVIIIF